MSDGINQNNNFGLMMDKVFLLAHPLRACDVLVHYLLISSFQIEVLPIKLNISSLWLGNHGGTYNLGNK